MRRFSREYWNLLWRMTVAEFKLKDQGTIFGFLWTLLYPALMFAALYLMFTKWMGNTVEDYPSYLLVGILQWQFFEKTTGAVLGSLYRPSLVKNFRFPLEILPFSVAGAVFLSYILEMAVLLVFLYYLGAHPMATWLYVPLLMLGNLAFSLSVGMILAMLAVEYRDMQRIWSILLMTGFFLTPVFYPLHILAQHRQALLIFNPMLHVVDVFRTALIGTKLISETGVTLVFGFGVIELFILCMVFERRRGKLVDRILAP
ncbi:MAG: ABC transporter permease [Elusimicrobia bacterium]|nr:ABC transporter permease [Elusimicrobiota bacterium]